MQHINWDNLRYVLMVANQGSISAAARALQVNRTTVLRRVNQFQESLNCRIFDRGDNGYALTPEAEKMIEAAREVETTLFNMQRQIEGRELKLEGEIRVTTTDTFMLSVLAPMLARFREKHPHIVVDVLITNNVLDLHRRDADVAIRPTSVPDANLVGRRLCDVSFGVYASKALAQATDRNNLFKQRWIGQVDSLRATPVGEWFHSLVDKSNICLRCDSYVAVKTAAEAGIGLALLPELLGNASDNLVHLQTLNPDFEIGLWLLTHPDLVRSARIHAFVDYLSEEFGSL